MDSRERKRDLPSDNDNDIENRKSRRDDNNHHPRKSYQQPPQNYKQPPPQSGFYPPPQSGYYPQHQSIYHPPPPPPPPPPPQSQFYPSPPQSEYYPSPAPQSGYYPSPAPQSGYYPPPPQTGIYFSQPRYDLNYQPPQYQSQQSYEYQPPYQSYQPSQSQQQQQPPQYQQQSYQQPFQHSQQQPHQYQLQSYQQPFQHSQQQPSQSQPQNQVFFQIPQDRNREYRDNSGVGGGDGNDNYGYSRSWERDNMSGGSGERFGNRIKGGFGSRDDNYGNRGYYREGRERESNSQSLSPPSFSKYMGVEESKSSNNSLSKKNTTTTTTSLSGIPPTSPSSTKHTLFTKRIRDEDIVDIATIKIDSEHRPKSSTPVKLVTNRYMLNTYKSVQIYQYDVAFIPPLFNKPKKYDIISSLSKKIGVNIYDGSALMYCISDSIKEHCFEIENDLRVKITLIQLLDEMTVIQFYNVFMKRIMRLLGYSVVGRQYYNSQLSKSIERSSLNIWPGYFTSVNKIADGISLLVDVSQKVIRRQSVLSTIKGAGSYGARGYRKSKQDIENELIGSIVITLYNNKTYRINSIDWSKTPNSKFSTDKGDISFLEYYKITYGKDIRTLDQPLLVSRSKGKNNDVFLIPELCNLTGISNEDRKNNSMMKEISEHINVESKRRFHTIQSLIDSIGSSEAIKEETSKWGLSFQTPIEVIGHQFPPPFKDVARYKKLKDIWAIIVPDDCYPSIDAFVRLMTDKFTMEKPSVKIIRFNPLGKDYSNAIKELVEKINPSFIVVVVSGAKTELYNSIKRTAILECKVITQVVTIKTITGQKIGSIFSKITNQISAKIDIPPWCLKDNSNLGIPNYTMIVGIDVGHNTDKESRSVAAFCASVNHSFTNFFVSCSIQKQNTKEVIHSLGNSMNCALRSYYSKNGRLPERIIVYRDGVGDGMLDQINKYEVSSIRESFSQLPQSMGPKPLLIYIVVKKQTHLRLFNMANDLSSPSQGVVVNKSVTKGGWYEFFLVSQKTHKGTANPTHYHVLQDDTDISIESLQLLTFNLCFLYFNFDQAVSVPMVCQYSHKSALLCGNSLNASTPDEMSNHLFFL
ncbi:hypothetical protein RB653_010018 [Dictyostelium firmibasis]|uniref:Argonaut-like protein n=1 Tax=Dictyostelium firmibasis TaxID=79012 RepID=A0AAN7TSI0_9MYCE